MSKSLHVWYVGAGMIVGIGLFLAILYLVNPRRMPRKSIVNKKTMYVSVQNGCTRTYANYRQEHGEFRLPILLYHYVEEVQDPRDVIRQRMNISPPVFQSQLELLKNNNYTTVFVKDIPSLMKNGKNICYPAAALTFDDGYEGFYTYVYPILKQYSMKATVYVIDEFIGKKDFMTEAQLKEVAASGLVEIGSHTISHANLLDISTEEARRQIVDSRTLLSQRLGMPIYTFAYPFGKFNAAHESLVQVAGYTVAVTVREGADFIESEVLQLPRVRPYQIARLEIL